MMCNLSIRGLALCVSLFAVSGVSAQILNGGFENPPLGPGGSQQFNSGSVIGGAWSVGGPSDVFLLSTSYTEPGLVFNSNTGGNALDITGAGNTGANTISQIIPGLSAGSYFLDFFLGRINSAINYNGPSSVSVTIDGVPFGNFSNPNNSVGTVNWIPVQIPFSSTGAPVTITFTNTTPAGQNYAGLDDISVSAVTAVPEPGSVAAAVGALGLVALRLRRRK